MAVPSAMQARADLPARRLFNLVELVLPASPLLPATTVRLVDGSFVVVCMGETWVGQDGDFGSWRAADALEEALATQSPKIVLHLATVSNEAQQQLGQPISQGSPITFYSGELDITTGVPVSDPELVFAGQLDIGHIVVDRNKRTIDIDVMSASELMFLNDDGAKLCSAYHNEFFPASLGFQFMDTLGHSVPWGAKGPRPDQATLSKNYDTDRGGGSTTLRF